MLSINLRDAAVLGRVKECKSKKPFMESCQLTVNGLHSRDPPVGVN